MKKIAMILRTDGLDYDDRIRKEMLTVMSLNPDIEFKIFAIIDGKYSLEEEGVTEYGVAYTIPRIKSRLKYKQGTHLIKKAWDFYRSVNPKLKDFDAIWCANFDPIMFILLSNKLKIWDMHELPPRRFLNNSLKKMILRFLMNRCKVVIHANAARLRYLKEIGVVKDEKNQFVIRNYPDMDETQIDSDVQYAEFVSWLRDSDCVYIQGIYEQARCDMECLEAIMQMRDLKAVVVGKVNKQVRSNLERKYGDKLSSKLFFTGMVPQKMTSYYIRACKASLIFYRNVGFNNYYCEPNRMFQSIINGCPVVVGCNPPMKELVDKYGFGVSLVDDGSNVTNIMGGLKKVLSNHSYYVECIEKNKHFVLWSQQNREFRKIINAIL